MFRISNFEFRIWFWLVQIRHCAILLLFAGSAAAQAESPAIEIAQSADSAFVKREKMPSRTVWEKVAYFPGRLIYFPIKYSLKGVNATIGYVDDSKIVPKINDILTTNDGRRGLKPTYAPRTGGGIIFYQKGLFSGDLNHDILELSSTAEFLERQRYKLTLEEIEFPGKLFTGDLLMQYQKLTTESFFGIGGDSRLSNETNFTQEQTTFELRLGRKISTTSSIKIAAGYEYTNIDEGRDTDIPSISEVFDVNLLPGCDNPVEMMRWQLSLKSDTKNKPGNPSKGYEVFLCGGLYQQIGDDDFGFTKYAADITEYIHLFYNRLLVLRIAGENIDSFNNRQVPFYYLSELGRKETIRGFSRGRFRDRDMLIASAEYRYPVWKNWDERGVDFLFFADAGQVSHDISRIRMDEFKPGLGFGLRMWNTEGLVAKLEAGKSDDGWRFYFVLN